MVEMVDQNQIICGDVLEVLKTLPGECVDTVCTDPPYNLGKDYGPWSNDRRSWPEYWAWFKDVFAEVYRVMGDGYLYVSHSDKGIYKAKPILEEVGFDYIQTLVWWGKNAGGRANNNRTWAYRHELILFMQKGHPVDLRYLERGMWYQSVIDVTRAQSNYKEGRDHPTQKPVRLYEILLYRVPGSVVLDPFLGSGSVAVACKKLGKTIVGIEINPEYHDVIKRRLGQEVLSF